MTVKPVVLRDRANKGIEEIVEYYRDEAAEQGASGFVDALERAFSRIGRHPAMGSSRYALELDLLGLRCWPLQRYPYLLFYVECGYCIDVWRILHRQREIPVWMQEPK